MPDASEHDGRLAQTKTVVRDHGIAPEPLSHEAPDDWQQRLWGELARHGWGRTDVPMKADALLFLLADVLQRKRYWT